METAAPLAVKTRGARGPWEPEWAAPHGFSPGASSCPCGASDLRSRETTSLSSLSRLVRGGVGSVAWSCGKCLPRSMLEDGVGGALFTGPARLGNESCPHALAHCSSGPGTQTKPRLGQPPHPAPQGFLQQLPPHPQRFGAGESRRLCVGSARGPAPGRASSRPPPSPSGTATPSPCLCVSPQGPFQAPQRVTWGPFPPTECPSRPRAREKAL